MPPRPMHARLALAVCAAVVAATTTASPPIALAQSPAGVPSVVSGAAHVVDGDTLVVNGHDRIRLYGVDAPESKQLCTDSQKREYACGVAAKDALAKRVAAAGGKVRCAVRERDQYGRLVAACSLAAPATGAGAEEDAGDFMVRRGMAVAYRKITAQYVAAEEYAKSRRAGVWQGEFEPPAKWRYERRVAEGGEGSGEMGSSSSAADFAFAGGAAAAKPPLTINVGGSSGSGSKGASSPPSSSSSAPPSSGCKIKGNISAKGLKIYHVPGDPTYDITKIDVSAGERYFCTVQEAERAGWRASRSPGAFGAAADGPAMAPMSNGAGRRR